VGQLLGSWRWGDIAVWLMPRSRLGRRQGRASPSKGADRWAAAADDRLIGALWAELSEGRCRFVMVKDKHWEWVETHLQ